MAKLKEVCKNYEKSIGYFKDPTWEMYPEVRDRLAFLGLVPTFSDREFEVDDHYDDNGNLVGHGAHLVPIEMYTGKYGPVEIYIHFGYDNPNYNTNSIEKLYRIM